MNAESPIRVMVTGASGDSALGVIRALRATGKAYFLAAVCINERSPGFLMSDVSAVAPPCRHEDAYVTFLVDFIRQHRIEVLIPTIDGELPLISERKAEMEQRSGAVIIVGEHKSIVTCCDKLLTSKYLSDIDVPQPRLISGGFEDVRRCIEGGVKVIMKPRMGGGSRGIRVLDTATLGCGDWMADGYVYQHFESYEKEYTSVVMKDGDEVAAMAVLERTLMGGRTVWCRRVRSTPYEPMLRAVASRLDIPYLNIQFGVVDGKLQVFDLNPRFSGSTSVFALIFNGPDLLVCRARTGQLPAFACSEKYFESMRYPADFIVERLSDA